MSEIGKAFCGESAQHTFNPILKNKYIPIEKSGYISHMQVHALFFTVYCNLYISLPANRKHPVPKSSKSGLLS